MPTPADLQVPAALIRRHGLRKGDLVEGVRGTQRALTEVARVNGRTPDALRTRRQFRDLTPSTRTSGSVWNTRRPGSPGGSPTSSLPSARASAD